MSKNKHSLPPERNRTDILLRVFAGLTVVFYPLGHIMGSSVLELYNF